MKIELFRLLIIAFASFSDLISNLFNLFSLIDTSDAVKFWPFFADIDEVMDQYLWLLKFSISISLSQIIFSATDWTLPADLTPDSLVHKIGEILKPVKINLSNHYLLVVKPNISISTEKAFSYIIPKKPKFSLLNEINKPIEKWNIKNDFENHTFTKNPELLEIKRSLIKAGAKYTSMSGSGSSIYGIFSAKPDVFFKNCQIFHQAL